MTLLDVYEKVNLVVPLEQRRFFNYFNDSVNELQSLFAGYDKDYVMEEGKEFKPLKSLHVPEGKHYFDEALAAGTYFFTWSYEEGNLKAGIYNFTISSQIPADGYIEIVFRGTVLPIDMCTISTYDDEGTSIQTGVSINKGKSGTDIGEIEDTGEPKYVVRPMYYDAIVENILFLAGAGEQHKSEFIRKGRNAFLKYWTENAKGRRVRRMRW